MEWSVASVFLTAMVSYNITTGDMLTKVFQRIPGGMTHTVCSTTDNNQNDTIVKHAVHIQGPQIFNF